MEILEHCELFSFINLLSTCRTFHNLWNMEYTINALFKALKNGMSLQAWMVYRFIKAIRWENLRIAAIEELDQSQSDHQLTDHDLPPHLRINFDRVFIRLDVNVPNAQSPLRLYPKLKEFVYGYGLINVEEKRYTVMKDLFYLQMVAKHWVHHFISARYQLTISEARLFILKGHYEAFYIYWLSELRNLENDRTLEDNPYDGRSYWLLEHAEDWLDIAGDYLVEWLKDSLLLHYEKEIYRLLNSEFSRVTHHFLCFNCLGIPPRGGGEDPDPLFKRRFRLLDIIYAPDSTQPSPFGGYESHAQPWEAYASKLQHFSQSWGVVEDLSLLEIDKKLEEEYQPYTRECERRSSHSPEAWLFL
ncbi:hypothetical protein TWF281_011005 [Arthrobotrys megalospora]